MKIQKITAFQIFSEVRFYKFRLSKYLKFLSKVRIKFLVILSTILILNIWYKKSPMAQEYSEEVSLEEALSEFDDQNEEDKVNEVPSAFDEDEFETTKDNKSLDIDGNWSSIYGITGLRLSYSYAKELPEEKTEADWSGLTKVEPFLSLTWDSKIGEKWKTRVSGKVFYNLAYSIKGREIFSKEVLNELEYEAELREFFIEGSPFTLLDVKLGKQIIVWGVGNSLRVVDVLNPTDNRELGMTDLEDRRLPINMIRLDYFIGNLKLEAVAIHEIKFNKSAPYGSDFNPANKKINEVIPENTPKNREYGLALIGIFRGWDTSLHWAQYFDDTYHSKISSKTIVPGVGVVPTYEMHHSRLTMAGMTLSIPSGNYLWKAEAAKLKGLEFALVTDKIFSRLDLLFGIEYSGLSETSVSIESVLQHLNDFDFRLEDFPDSKREKSYVNSLSFEQDYFNKTLHFNILGMIFGKSGRDGGINRFSLKYEVLDACSVKGGVMIYQSGEDSYFKSLNENDRFFFEVRYSF